VVFSVPVFWTWMPVKPFCQLFATTRGALRLVLARSTGGAAYSSTEGVVYPGRPSDSSSTVAAIWPLNELTRAENRGGGLSGASAYR
jgi:hypothetical protein